MQTARIYHPEIPGFLSECAQTPVVQRLKDVGMNCGCEYTSFPLFRRLRPYTRYEHSLGAALIVWHFTRDRAQAVAALLHDIATPVFAHVVDFLRGDYLTQESTEAGTAELIDGSPELQRLLRLNGLETRDVCDYHRYPIADNASPQLSADRLEYTLGNLLHYGFCDVETACRFYGDLTVGNDETGRDELVFRTPQTAEAFAFGALRCARVYVSDEDRYAMQRLSELLRFALEHGILSEQDLYTTEPEVIAKLTADSRTAAQWSRFCAFARIRRADAPGPGEGWRRIHAKKRWIDPQAAGAGRVSEFSPSFAADLALFLREDQDGWVCAEEEAERSAP